MPEQMMQTHEESIGRFTLEPARTINHEEKEALCNLFLESPEHEIGMHTLQRSEPSTEELEVLLSDPSVTKYIVREEKEPIGFYLIGRLKDIQRHQQNIASTQYYQEDRFLQDLPLGIQKRTQEERETGTFRHIPYNIHPPLTEEHLLEVISKQNPLLYLVGQGWFRTGQSNIKGSVMEYIRTNRLREDFPTTDGSPSLLFFELPQGDMIPKPDINGCHASGEQFPYFQIGQQDYLFVAPIDKKRQKLVSTALDMFRMYVVERKTESINSVKLTVDQATQKLIDKQVVQLSKDLSLRILTEGSSKISLLHDLWEAYERTFHRNREQEECRSIQIQSQSKEELEAVLRDPSSTVFIVSTQKEDISGFWVTFSDLKGINERNTDIGGIHSVRMDLNLTLDIGNLNFYTYTIGSVPDRMTNKPSRTIERAFFPVLIGLMREGASLMGDMSCTTKASTRIFRHLSRIPLIDSKVQSQCWFLTVST